MENNQLQVDVPEGMRGGDKVVDTTEEILDILNETKDDGEETKEKKAPKEEKEAGEEDKEDDDVKEEEIEEDETTKEDSVDELITPVALKEITTKYPNLLKEFPFLEKAYYREKKFTEIFPTVQDAREAQERLENVASLEAEVIGSGKTETILKAIKDSNPQKFAELVDDYLPALERVEPGAQAHIASNIVRGIVLRMYGAGQQSKNENLQNAALVLSDYFWPGQQPAPPQSFNGVASNKVPPQEEKLTQERQQFETEKFTYVATDLNTKVQNALKATIDNNLDKDNLMPEFVKRNAIKEVQENLEKVLSSDSRFRNHINTLWSRAKQGNYNRTHMDNIRSAYLGKAKTVLGPIIVKVRNEALKGVRRTERQSTEDKRGPVSTGRPAGESKSSSGKKSIPAGMSVDDYLMSD